MTVLLAVFAALILGAFACALLALLTHYVEPTDLFRPAPRYKRSRS